MSRYPRNAQMARVKCIECNAPVVKTVEGQFACVSCGEVRISSRDGSGD